MAGQAPQMAQAIEVSDRRGCDLFPIDLGDATARRRMASYIWGDMAQRADRQKQALAALKGQVPVIDRADAAGWVAAQIMQRPAGETTVLFHSLVWPYLNVSQRMAVESSFEQAAETASPDRPLAWLRMDVDRMDHEAVLEYDLWQGGAVQKPVWLCVTRMALGQILPPNLCFLPARREIHPANAGALTAIAQP